MYIKEHNGGAGTQQKENHTSSLGSNRWQACSSHTTCLPERMVLLVMGCCWCAWKATREWGAICGWVLLWFECLVRGWLATSGSWKWSLLLGQWTSSGGVWRVTVTEMSIGPDSLKQSELDAVLDAIPGRPYCMCIDTRGGTFTGGLQLPDLVVILYGMVRKRHKRQET